MKRRDILGIMTPPNILDPDYAFHPHEGTRTTVKERYNWWSQVKPEHFAKDYDFRTIALEGDRTAIYCESIASLYWCYTWLDESTDRYADKGFILSNDVLRNKIGSMERDKLVAQETFWDNLELQNQFAAMEDEG